MTPYFLLSQNLIQGQVLDQLSQEALPGVNVFDQESGIGTSTNSEGFFEIRIEKLDGELTFSSIGYSSKTIQVENSDFLKIELEPADIGLSEVLITALGLERESKDLGYAVQEVQSREISEVKSVNFVDNLAGKVAGVRIDQGATGVGSSSKISIRGEASFTNNNPLFVVDGTPINNNSIINTTNEAAAGFQEVDFGNGAMELNADEIASVSVLKGPGAAALYGTRASNGVIVISTKDGSEQQGLGLSFNSSTFVEQAFQLPEFQNSYGQGNSGEFEFVDGLGAGINDNITYSWGPALDQGLLIPQFDSPVELADGSTVRGGDVAVHGGAPITPTPFVSNPDNLKDFYQTGVTSINSLAISSGFENGSFRLSVSDLRSESIIPGVNLERNNISTRLHFNPTEKLEINASIHYIKSSSDNRPSGGYGSENINYSLVAWGPRSMDYSSLESYWQPGLEDVQQFSFNYTFFDNPYFILLENRNSFDRDRIFGNISARYQISPKFSAFLRSGTDYSDELRQFRRAYSSNRFINGAYAEQDVFYRETNTDVLINYKDELGAFQLDISFGANRLDQTASSIQTQAVSLAQPGIYSLSNASSPLEVFQVESQKRINSLYAFAKLGYEGILYLELTGRNDWSSALATPTSSTNSSFFYPSVSLAYLLSEHIDLGKPISFLKLRASLAEVGNDTDPYQTSVAFVAQTPFNSQPTFSASSLIPNEGLLPEQTRALELGFDIRFMDDRLRFDATYYDAQTSNQIIALPVSISSGYTEEVVNGAQVRSRGVELIAAYDWFSGKKFRWTSQWNFSLNRTIVEDLPQGIDRLTLAYSRVYDNVNQTVWFQVDEGGQIGDMYGTGYLKNENGDFVIDENGRFIADNNLMYLGNYNADFNLAMNNYLSYDNWSFSFLLDWRQGGELVSRTLSLAAVGGQLAETENRPEEGIVAQGVVNTGTAENPIWTANTTAQTAESYYRQFYDRNHEENNIYDASFLKLRQMAISYRFDMMAEKGFFQKGRSFELSLIGRNLWAASEIPHFDPEQLAVQGNQFVRGVEDMSYATTRSFGFKLGYQF
jgi:TonB-linked SusC/RagA family outer membrane protein